MPTRFRLLGFSLSLVMLAGLGACRQEPTYGQSTPESTLGSAVDMVKNGDAHRLVDLVYADDERMREALDNLGVLLKHAQELADAVREEFPEEVDAAMNDATNPEGSLLTMMQMSIEAEGGEPGEVGDFLGRILADPYGWLERSADRLSVQPVTDDMAAILFDDQPIFPPVGLPMKLEDGKWYVAPPTGMASQYLPQTEAQWQIVESMIVVLDRAVRETEQEVRKGDVASVQRLGSETFESLMIPIGIAAVAYGHEMEIRDRVNNRLKPFNKRMRSWVKDRRDQENGEVARSFQRAAKRVAAVQIECGIRYDEPTDVASMDDAAFEELLGDWFAEHGLSINVAGDLRETSVDDVIESWTTGKGAVLRVPDRRRDRRNEPLKYLPESARRRGG